MQKGVYMRWTRAELTWHDANMWRHHGSWHGPMRAIVGTYIAWWINQAKYVGPTSIVGPIVRISGRTKAHWVTQNHTRGTRYIRDIFSPFHPYGTKVLFWFAGNVADCGASDLTSEKTCIDLVDFSPLDLHHTHVTNARPSISLVKSNARDLIAHSANDRATRGCMTMLRWTLDGENRGGVEPTS